MTDQVNVHETAHAYSWPDVNNGYTITGYYLRIIQDSRFSAWKLEIK